VDFSLVLCEKLAEEPSAAKYLINLYDFVTQSSWVIATNVKGRKRSRRFSESLIGAIELVCSTSGQIEQLIYSI